MCILPSSTAYLPYHCNIHFATLQVRNNCKYNKFLQTTAQSWWLLCPLRLNAFSLPEYKKETKLVKFNEITSEIIKVKDQGVSIPFFRGHTDIFQSL